MMKKILALLLCMALLLPMAAHAKTFSYTIPQLIARQLNSGGTSLRVKVSAAAEGAAIAGMDAQAWNMFGQVLANIQGSGTYFKSKSGNTAGDQQIKASLAKGEEVLSALTITGQGDAWYLESDLLPGKTYALTRDAAQAYMNLTAPEDGQWPDVLRLFTAIDQAGTDFAAKLDSAMSVHVAGLNRWLQSYTQVEMQADKTGVSMQQKIAVPASAVKQQMKDFLSGIYADHALLALLRTAVPEADAQVYLERGMLGLYHQAIDDMQLEGEIVITRAYDGAGTLSSEQITLPFGSGMPVREVTVARGEKMGLAVEFSDGTAFSLMAAGSMQNGKGAYDGEISLRSAGSDKAFEALFTLAVNVGMEQYLEENTSRERDQQHEISLLIRPKDSESFASQQITATVHLMAGASNTKPAYVDTKILWCDLQSGGRLMLNVLGNTSSGLRHSEVDKEQTLQADMLNRADRSELLEDIGEKLGGAIENLLAKLLSN